jgi:mannose-6-phosphate isomerase-like protein (cupin superfamily)
MSDFDDIYHGLFSRRKLIERISAAGLSLPLFDLSANAQTKKGQTKQSSGDDDDVKMSPENIGGGGRVERNFYRGWVKKAKIPIVEGYSIFDAKTQEVQPWPEIGGRGVYLNFSGNVHMDGVIIEIPESKALAPRRQFYEQLVYVIAGRGSTVFGDAQHKNKVDWGEGSLFTVPMNVLHQHSNSDSQHPARLLAITTFPFMMQVFGSLGLIDDTTFSFGERYDGSPDYFSKSQRVQKRWDKTNFVRDIRSSEVIPWEERGKGNASMFWEMGGNTVLEPHMSDFPVGSYKLGHRHPYEAIILTLNGKGFTLFDKEHLKDSDALKLDWKAGSVVSPPYYWYHQHFNTGDTRARYFAVTEGDFPKRLGIPLEVEQIEAPQEDPDIKKHFERERRKPSAHNAHPHHHHHHEG